MPDLSIDQQLDQLDDAIRRLKVEYDIYFAGGKRRPPVEGEGRLRVEIRRFMENSRLSLAQRYRLQGQAQRVTVYADLWRRKAKIKDSGYVKPEDKLLGVGGFGHLEEPATAPAGRQEDAESFVLFTGDMFEVVPLFEAVLRAREVAGQPLGAFDSFASYVQAKSDTLRNQYRCDAVEYTVMVKDGKVRLKARPRKDL